ncbi:N-acetylmuramoyl-L-alanine amidase [Clostridium sp.]|uniref:N-acetylmuramoyl-L-alanine amidase n=1 Tax=Clostridium sp. TaxID=1506 RepID=UPI00290F478F|nr:N-acetylmuramoyl-L-alanine amidase [Clostridium sp.]MDU3411733.1 N-acetylmuramoyl-L-alanine amidase [Clostridium sp.]
MKLNCIGIDIGHNLRCDVGAVGIRREDELNLLVGKALIKKFRGKGIKVVECLPSSASSHRDSLSKRCRAANYGKVDMFISIHHNACPGGYGSECLCIKGGQQNALSERLSKVILEEVCKLGFRNRGVKDRRDLYVINNTTMPAIIVECAFVDSASDMNGYDSERMADAIFRGVCRFCGISLSGDQGELGGTSISGGGGNLGGTSTSGSQDGTSSSGNQGGTGNPKYHVVQKGDTLWGISMKYGVSVEDLVRINGIKDRNMIYVGQKLKIYY